MDKNLEKYKETYVPLLNEYARKLLQVNEASDYAHIPQVFIPEWGVDYFKSDIRIAFVGLETYGWGDTETFLNEYKQGSVESAYDMSEFQALDFLHWNDTHRHTFWGFNSFFLGALYGLKNWEVLKWGQHKDILRTIAWGNATSIERWGNCAGYGSKNWDAWLKAKTESTVFDDIELLLTTCRPHVVLLLCGKNDGRRYLRNQTDAARKPIWTGGNVEIYRIGETYVFHAFHPAAMKFNGGAQHYAQIIREKMIEYGVFRPLPSSVKDDAVSESFIMDLIRASLVMPRPDTFEVVKKVAVLLRKQESIMPVSMLTRILNGVGCRNNWGDEYAGGRGVYRMLHHFYHRSGLNDEERDAIAMAFVNEWGWHPWDK